jgi:hypothetical protein
VPGQVFAPAKNHATIAITTTLERFCRRGAITPVHACAVLEVRLGVREDKGCGHVSVGGVRGRGVHYRGRDGGERATRLKPDRYKHFPCLIFFLFIFLSRATPSVPLRFFLALILIRTNAITHPHSSSPNPSILLRPLQIPDPLPPSLLPFPFLTSLSALFPHVSPPLHSHLCCFFIIPTTLCRSWITRNPRISHPQRQCQFELSQFFTALTTIGTKKTGPLTYLTSRFQNAASPSEKKNRRNLA